MLPEDPKAAKATLNGKPLVNALKGASGDAFQALTRAVAGIEVAIETLEGQCKLSQNKAPRDRRGAVAGLERRGDPASLAVAALMGRDLAE